MLRSMLRTTQDSLQRVAPKSPSSKVGCTKHEPPGSAARRLARQKPWRGCCPSSHLCDGPSSGCSTARASNGCSMRRLKQVSSAGTASSTISSAVALRLPSAGWPLILYADVCSCSLLACGRHFCDGTGFNFTLPTRAGSASVGSTGWLLQDDAVTCSRDVAHPCRQLQSQHTDQCMCGRPLLRSASGWP